MYLVLSALTSSPISLVAATKPFAVSFSVCILLPSTLKSSALLVYNPHTYLGETFYSPVPLSNVDRPTYLTIWSKGFPDKLTVPLLILKFPAF